MSSIVKKSSHFVPKLKKRAARASKSAQTPPTTQESQVSPDPSQKTQTEEASVLTPPPTQADKNDHPLLLSYQIAVATSLSLQKPIEEENEIVDPKDTSKAANEEAIQEEDSENEQEDQENDIFQKALAENHDLRKMQRRKSSVASRRLSGIFARSGSISTPGAVGAEETRAAPVSIGIPSSRPLKRSKLTSGSISKRKKSSVITVQPPDGTLVEEDESNGLSKEESKREIIASLQSGNETYVVGIDPKTNKFMKFRVSKDVKAPRNIPVAPEDLITEVTSLSQLPRKVSKEDEALFSQLKVLADELTVAELCKPTIRIGSTSDKFQMAEDGKKLMLQKRETRRRARKLAQKERISYDEALKRLGESTEPADSEKQKINLTEAEEPEATKSKLAVKMVNGVIQLDHESTIRSNSSIPNADGREIEQANPYMEPITSNSYTKLTYTDTWSTEELMQFYNALSTWGTDFTFIAQLFPHRNRRQIKRKFTLEEKKRPELVELALRRKLPPDLQAYCQTAENGTTFKSLKEYNEEVKKLREEHEKHMNEIQSEREKAIKEDLETSRKREMELRTGSRIMTRAERERELRKNEEVVGTVDDVRMPHRLKGEV